ncbi:MAG TPA: CBS domain-containing protein [Candidatus Eisenbacteria bacterium]|nr:CBS domain-containing protein [Candidatus Eisenbacteria bacterium]
MATTVADVMTPDPVAMDGKEPVTKAAAAMRDHSIGTVVVMTDGKPCGVVTDRDITVKAVATGGDLSKMPLEQICSKKVVAVAPGQSVDDAVQVMKSHDVKRILVVEGKQLKGIVSLGDLASRRLEGDLEQDLSRAEPNN